MAHSVSMPGFHLPSFSLPHRLGETLRTWQTRSRERQELAKFTLFDLKDIGMTDAERSFQLSKPLWRA